MNTRQLIIAAAMAAVLLVLPAVHAANPAWTSRLNGELPLLGHRNWIVIADAAYPWQTAPGIETISTDEDQLMVVKVVLDALSRVKHVKPTIYTDAELPHVPESDAKGVTDYRERLKKLLEGRNAQSKPHEQIIADLDAAGKTFHVLLLKTRMTIPYTSVFVQLDCGYWDSAAEQKLREAMKSEPK